MPLPPKLPNHPLRLLRVTLGLSRKQFAEVIGVAADTIVSLENDRLPMSERLARRICLITGAHYRELVKGKEGKLRNVDGKPYDPTKYYRRRELLSFAPKKITAKHSSRLCRHVEALLSAAAKKGRMVFAYLDVLEAIEGSESRN